MSELNFDILQENIRKLMKNKGIKQQELAEIAGMSQANVSKALNPNESKQFTIDQVFRIAQYFGASIDDLTGNQSARSAETSPQAALKFITALASANKIKNTTITVKEWIFEPYPDGSNCKQEERDNEYPAFYFPSYYRIGDLAETEYDEQEVFQNFLNGGNDTPFFQLNEILKKFLPIVKLYREGEIPEEAFKMVLDGYLEQLPER